jgi:pyruvate,orthophosphate dikinase
MTTRKWIYRFEEGNAEMRDLLGGKGANLAEMSRLGLPVPPGFTITTETCNDYLAAGNQLPEGLWERVLAEMDVLSEKMGRRFGDSENPLLVSVRSGAKFSMPGMMDTVLNLGLNDQSVQGLAAQTEDPRFAWDAYRRLVQMYGKVVIDVPGELFEEILHAARAKAGVQTDPELGVEDWQAVTARFKELIQKEAGRPFPQDPYEQLRGAVEAVFLSWNGKRAIDYRNSQNIPHDLGTAVNIMAMVFGNVGWDSGSGVAFTRDPATGEDALYGEYLANAQGEDVVSGARTPKKVAEMADERDLADAYHGLAEIAKKLENHYTDMQDLEFTIEHGKLWMLQTRTGKRTAAAAVKIAVDMVNEGVIDKALAVMRIEPDQLNQLLHPRFDPEALAKASEEGQFLASGLNASPGAAVGMAAFDADTAEEWGKAGKPVILIRPETNPDDVHGMLTSKGILTQHGGATSHAAVVARGIGLPCVAGCEAMRVDVDKHQATFGNGVTIKEGDFISIDGAAGAIYQGQIPTMQVSLEDQKELRTLLTWADEFRRLGVWANADYPRDAERARTFGAEGIGLCRTEHMFFEEDRLPIVQQMILAETDEERQEALDRLEPIQQSDFEGIFEVMDGLPVIIRLIDPPLHEFLPPYDELVAEVAVLRETGKDKKRLEELEILLSAVRAMREANPMLGLRGVRLGIVWPAINEMQVRAIFKAACAVAGRGVTVKPEVMIPLVAHISELSTLQGLLEREATKVLEAEGIEMEYKFGTMIEIPRAALTAGEIAQAAQFFSFGTNDLTQMTFGISRDDAEGKFLLKYVEDGLLPANPFQTVDQIGVGRLMKYAVEEGRAARPDLEVGICGEHGGDPESVEFCHRIGLNYVSCSPFRVPIARLAAAHAALKEQGDIHRDK